MSGFKPDLLGHDAFRRGLVRSALAGLEKRITGQELGGHHDGARIDPMVFSWWNPGEKTMPRGETGVSAG
jgi:hypothetical protein